MKINIMIGMMVLTGFLAMTPALAADVDQLETDYRQLVEKRKELEEKRRVYETELESLSGQMQKISRTLNDCIYETRLAALKAKRKSIYENWRLLWESRLKEIEITRKSAEKERGIIIRTWRDLDNIRQEVENKRMEIEKEHKETKDYKTYESRFRAYMKELEDRYFNMITSDLFQGYEAYLDCVNGYIRFLESSLVLCRDKTI